MPQLNVRALVALSLSALAFASTGCAMDTEDEVGQQSENITHHGDFPDAWEVGMIEAACKIRFTGEPVEGRDRDTDGFELDGETYGPGIVYEALYDGEVIAAAWAKNDTIFAKKRCLFY